MSEISKINIPDQTSQTGTATYDIKDSNARTRIVDSGTKNKLMISESVLTTYPKNRTVNGVTFTINSDDQTISVTGQITDNTQDATFTFGTCDTVLGDLLYEGFETANSLAYIETTTGNTKLNVNPVEPISSSDIGTGKQFRIVIDKGYVGEIDLTFKPMVCSSEDFEVSDEYVPYAKSNYELTKNCGERVFGKTFSDNTIGGRYAEIFNDYSTNKASGNWSHAEGYYTTASGTWSHAEGAGTRAAGEWSHAEGCRTTASGISSHTEGFGTEASGEESHAEGGATTASGKYSHAEGESTTASGNYSHTEGSNTTASAQYSHAEGYYTTASGNYSHAEGESTTAASQHQHTQGKFNVVDSSGTYAFIIGNGTSTSARHNAFAIDWNGLIYVNGATTGVDVSQLTPVTVDQTYDGTSANAQSGVAIESKKPGLKTDGTSYTIDGETVTAGSNCEIFNDYEDNMAIGHYSHAEGVETIARGYASHAEGQETIASGMWSHAEGSQNTASGTDSHAEGAGTKASGVCSHAEGTSTTASGDYSHAEGDSTEASGKYSHAEGSTTEASGDYSHAEGRDTVASGSCSHAGGYDTTASGDYSYASGNYNTVANKQFSHAEGFWCTASGDYSYVKGNRSTSSGNYSHAEGYYCTASGLNSVAVGERCTASGNYSAAFGIYASASSANQFVIGKNNSADANGKYAFIIGNGTPSVRHNALCVDWDGLIYVNGATTGVDVAALAATIGDINTVLESVL